MGLKEYKFRLVALKFLRVVLALVLALSIALNFNLYLDLITLKKLYREVTKTELKDIKEIVDDERAIKRIEAQENLKEKIKVLENKND